MILKEKTVVMVGNKPVPLMVVKNVNELLNHADKEENIPFWAELWPSSLAMADYLWVGGAGEGLKVLELGAGLGLPGIVAAMRGAQVTQTDFIREALDITGENARLNGVCTRLLKEDWRNFKLQEKFDLIIGSDILYEPVLHDDIKRILQNNLYPHGRVLLSDPGREPAAGFILNMEQEGWQARKYNYDIEQRAISYHITLWELKPTRQENQNN